MRALAVTTLLVLGSACGTDAKGESCGLLDLLVDGDGEQYCPDESAPDDCEALFETMVDAAVECANGAVSEEDLRAELAAQGVVPDCDEAVATDVTYEDCLAGLEDPTCDGLSFENPEECVGAIKVAG